MSRSVFTPEEGAVWIQLADRAAIAARAPAEKAQKGLASITGRARRTPVAGILNKSNPCVLLVDVCKRYLNETTRGRLLLQLEMAELAEQVREAVQIALGNTRLDIHG